MMTTNGRAGFFDEYRTVSRPSSVSPVRHFEPPDGTPGLPGAAGGSRGAEILAEKVALRSLFHFISSFSSSSDCQPAIAAVIHADPLFRALSEKGLKNRRIDPFFPYFIGE